MPSNNYGDYSSPAEQVPSATQTFLSGVGENISQQGDAIQITQPHLAGVPDSQLAWANWNSGAVGSTGNKFS